ncbi:MAG: hypothetical protein F7B18_01900 [Desulfurococcales archaeon]|nr:hypothetical protein [Desulfurococcales archaeon]
MLARETILKVLTVLAMISYIGVNFVAPLPRFLVAENLVYAALYGLGLLLMPRRPVDARVLLAGLAGFNAGRVSRSIIEPTGVLTPLARDHIPLFIVLLAIMILSLQDLRGLRSR